MKAALLASPLAEFLAKWEEAQELPPMPKAEIVTAEEFAEAA